MLYPSAPHIAAIDSEVTRNTSVHIVTEGVPAFSTCIPSCTLHALQEPQLPIATMTKSHSLAIFSIMSGSVGFPADGF